jgi:hypothetical protein
MKRVILLSLSILLSYLCFAQIEETVDSREQKRLRKEERKEAKRLEQEKAMAITKHLIDTRRFILIADYIGNNTGNRILVNSTINFLKIDTSHCVIQIGSLDGIGYNGVGGVTAEGRISKFEMTQNKRGDSYNMRLTANTIIGTYDIVVFVNAYGNADATITGITSGALRYYGRIIPIENSRIYQGRSL